MTQRIEVPGMGTVEFPDDMTDDQIVAAIRANQPQQDSVGRIAAQGVRGVNQALYGAAAAPFDAAAWLTRKLGLTEGPSQIGEAIRRAPDAIATTAGQALGIEHGPMEPQTRGEKIAGKVGEGVGNVLATLVPAGLVARAAAPGSVTQGVAQTLASQPGGQLAAGAIGGAVEGATDSPLAGTAAAIATPLAMAAGRGVISPVRQRLNPQEQALVQAAQREGIPLTPAQLTGSPTLEGVEAAMARLPLANTPMQNTLANQRQAFNRAVMSRTGQAADNVAPATIDDAFTRLGAEFDRLAGQTQVRLDRTFGQALQRVEQDYGRRLPTDVRPVFESYMRDFEPIQRMLLQPGVTPRIPGQTYANVRSDISGRIRETDNPSLRTALGQLVQTLDDAMSRSVTGPTRDAWQTARRQYQALMTIDKAARGGTQVTRGRADLGYGALNQAVRSADQQGYARGRGQLNEIARVGDYLAGKVPNSGTPERAIYSNALTGGALFGGGAALGAGVPAAAAMAVTPYVLSRLYNSPLGRRYLTNQMAGRTNFGALYGGQAAQGLLGP